ncbi:MAG: helix-hairpin-helix domain-containing protein [Fimbriimonadales bacterium]
MWYSLSAREKLGITSVAAAAIAGAGWMGFKQVVSPTQRSFAPGVQVQASPLFSIHVAGAVRKPGVVRVNEGMMVQDAIRLAGGQTADANPNAVNLAAPLVANSQLYIPAVSEIVSSSQLGPYAPGPQSTGGQAGGVVSINSATEAELDTLPGVGPVTARAIISHRSAIGRFRSVDQLLDVKGIGPVKLAKMRGRVTL